MLKFMALFLLATSFSTYAATVKITSFVFVRNNQVLAELCGVVEGAKSVPSFVKVNVDHTGRRPGIYNAVAGEDGKFCLAVVTYRGEAEASVIGQTTTTEAVIR